MDETIQGTLSWRPLRSDDLPLMAEWLREPQLAEFIAHVDVPNGVVELDYFLAEQRLRGRGLGSRMIAAAVEDTWISYPTAPAVLVAVVAANIASWRALEKAELTRVAEGAMSPDNPIDDRLHYIYRVDRPRRPCPGGQSD